MKKIALDTNIAIGLLNDDLKIVEQVQPYGNFYLPVTVCGELLFGALNSVKKNSNLKKVNKLIQSCKILHTNMLIAESYAKIRLNLKQLGKPIPENDIWIAAICRVNKIPLLTKDKHFSFVEALKLV